MDSALAESENIGFIYIYIYIYIYEFDSNPKPGDLLRNDLTTALPEHLD